MSHISILHWRMEMYDFFDELITGSRDKTYMNIFAGLAMVEALFDICQGAQNPNLAMMVIPRCTDYNDVGF